jgi:ferredoxin
MKAAPYELNPPRSLPADKPISTDPGARSQQNPIESAVALRNVFRSAVFNRTDGMDAFGSDFRSFREMPPVIRSGLPQAADLEEAHLPGRSSETCALHRTIEPPQSRSPRISRGCLRAQACNCLLCKDACPFGALQEAEYGMDMHQHLCRACGLCETACPAGVGMLRHACLASFLHSGLSQRAEAVGPPEVIICRSETRSGCRDDFLSSGPALWLEVDAIGRIGVEILLAAMAWGASRVTVWLPASAPEAVKSSVHLHARLASAILESIGQPPARIVSTENPMLKPLPPKADRLTPAIFAPAENKRDLMRSAVRHLVHQSSSPAEAIDLPQGTPYGSIAVSAQNCTFCMACAGVCPTRALSAEGEQPALRFVESRCVQCGRCARVCPEHAISLIPRLLFDPEAVEATRVLAAEAAIACVRCGKPFAPGSMVARLTAKLKGHWMYRRPEELQRLKMCAPCRVRDLYSACRSGT